MKKELTEIGIIKNGNCKSIFKFSNSKISKFILLITFFLSLITCNAQTIYEAPKLTCVKNNSTAPANTELNWNLPVTANPCFVGYEIYGSTGNVNGPYLLITTINNPLQTSIQFNSAIVPTPTSDDATVTHFFIINRGSCNNPSPPIKTTSDTLSNRTRQPFVPFVSASVVNNDIVVTWQPAPSVEVIGYKIKNSGDGFTAETTILGRLNTQFIDVINDPNATTIEYSIAAMESCEVGLGTSSLFAGETHKTIFLKNSPPDKCTQSINISWSFYKAGTASVTRYEIETNTANAGFVTTGTTDNVTPNFLLRDVPYNKRYCFRVKAILPNGAFAYSNEICYDSLAVVQKAKDDYIRNISVENGSIIIDYRKDTFATPEKNIILQRGEDATVYIPLSNVPTFNNYQRAIFDDNGLDVNGKTYFYRVRLNDSCAGSDPHYSDTATTLRITVKLKNSNTADIIWSGFQIDNINFLRYRLDKIVGTDTTFVSYFTRTDNTFFVNELFDYSQDSIPQICYRITAEFYNLNDKAPRELLQSHSNIICITPEPKIFIPQAFVPHGYNKTFKPFLLYAKTEGYSFQIYDRWHELLFTTNDINESWNGMYKGKDAPLDGYVYLIKYVGKNEKEYSITGTIMLIR
ncbi:MAG TPA: gliding motility-associated C-terminal domain-containing protein [Chitinophagales bacterium]|nr:gliding motility-associated C-terminal domain-containing protein [Chitinophagales bacterium]